jgi:hypothetical protein
VFLFEGGFMDEKDQKSQASGFFEVEELDGQDVEDVIGGSAGTNYECMNDSCGRFINNSCQDVNCGAAIA